ncbi:MAG: hypothetical protein FWC00_04585 [Firmicutes bacterium]|nr:hypothetical protein [Bacillota bacterium]
MVAGITGLIARSFIVFMLAYLWLSFYVANIVLVFIISFFITAAVNTLFYILKIRRSARAKVTREEKKHINQIMLQFRFQAQAKTLNLMKTAFQILGRQVVSTQKKLKFYRAVDEHEENPTLCNMFLLFQINPTVDDVVKCISATNKGAITYIASESFHPSVIAYVASLDKQVVLMDGTDVYKQLLEPAQIFPDFTVHYKTRQRLQLNELKRVMFMRTKSKSYIFLGVIILATSFIVRFNIYYIIIASVLFLFALLSLFALPSKDARI